MGYFLVFSVIDNVSDSYSVLTDVRHVNELSHVLKFVSGIVAQRSEEAAVSIIESIASIVNIIGLTSQVYFYLRAANILIEECETCSEDLYAKVVRALGERLQLLDVVVRPSSFAWNSEFTETFFQALAFNSTVASLNLNGWMYNNVPSHSFFYNNVPSHLFLDLCVGDEGANSVAQARSVEELKSQGRL